MPRKPRIFSKYLPFHIYARCNNKEAFQIDLRKVWHIFEEHLWLLHNLYNIKIHSFALMPNHYHSICSTPLNNRAQAWLWFQTSLAKTINLYTERVNHLWGGCYKAQAIWDPLHYAIAYKYVLRNPVKARIIRKPEFYTFSSLNQILGQSPCRIPLTPHPLDFCGLIPDEICSELNWLNIPFRNEVETALERTLKRKVFKLPQAILDNKSLNKL